MEEAFPRGKTAVPAGAAAAASAAPRGRSAGKDRLFGTKPAGDGKERRSASTKRPRSESKPAAASDKAKGDKSRYFEPEALTKEGPNVKRADELSFKRLRPGAVMLCRVKAVERGQAVLSLPHGLTAFVSASEVNECVPASIAASARKGAAKAAEAEEDDDSSADDAAPAATPEKVTLATFLVPGQYVLATATQVGGESLRGAAANPALALAKSLLKTTATGAKAVAGVEASTSRKIHASLRPDLCNAGLTMAQVRVGSVVWGHVKSVEDNGYIVATGISGVSAFLPFANADDGTAGQAGTTLARTLPAGTPLFATVKNINRAASAITLACSAGAVAGAVSREATHTISTLKPGMLVTATVDRHLANGVSVSFMAFFKGTIHVAHLPFPGHALWGQDARVAPGEALAARILYVDIPEKVIALTAIPHAVGLGTLAAVAAPKKALSSAAGAGGDSDGEEGEDGAGGRKGKGGSKGPGGKGKKAAAAAAADEGDASASGGAAVIVDELMGLGGPAFHGVADGDVIEAATVLRVDVDLGMLIGWGEAPADAAAAASGGKKAPLEERIKGAAAWGSTGYVHISRVVDGGRCEHIERLYKPGDTVRARVIGAALMEGAAVAATKPSIVDAAVLRVADVTPGGLYLATVDEVLPGEARADARPSSLPKHLRAATVDFATGKGVVATVRLGDGILAVVPALHVSDVLPTHALASAKARDRFLSSVGLTSGAKVWVRVLSVNAASGRIVASLKRTLVGTDLPVVASFAQAAQALEACAAGKPLPAAVIPAAAAAAAAAPAAPAGAASATSDDSEADEAMAGVPTGALKVGAGGATHAAPVASSSSSSSSAAAANGASTAATATGVRPLILHGFVSGVRDAGAIVTFCGDAHGLLPVEDIVATGIIPASRATTTTVKDASGLRDIVKTTVPLPLLQEAFPIGRVMQVRVVSVDVRRGHMRLSAQLDPAAADAAAAAAAGASGSSSSGGLPTVPVPEAAIPAAGTLVSATVISNDEAKQRLIVRITAARSAPAATGDDADEDDDAAVTAPFAAATLLAELPYTHLTDHAAGPGADHHISELLSCAAITAPGATLANLLVLQKLPLPRQAAPGTRAAADAPRLTVTAKPLLLHAATSPLAASSDMLPASFDVLRPGLLVAGYVASVTAFGAFVRFLDGLTGLAPRSKWATPATGTTGKVDGEEEGDEKEYAVGETVLAVVDSVSGGGATAGAAGAASKASSTGGDKKQRLTLSMLPAAVARVLPPAFTLEATGKAALPPLVVAALGAAAAEDAAAAAGGKRAAGAPVPAEATYTLEATALRNLLLEEEAALACSPLVALAQDDEEEGSDDEEDKAEAEGDEDEEEGTGKKAKEEEEEGDASSTSTTTFTAVNASRFLFPPGTTITGTVAQIEGAVVVVELPTPKAALTSLLLSAAQQDADEADPLASAEEEAEGAAPIHGVGVLPIPRPAATDAAEADEEATAAAEAAVAALGLAVGSPVVVRLLDVDPSNNGAHVEIIGAPGVAAAAAAASATPKSSKKAAKTAAAAAAAPEATAPAAPPHASTFLSLGQAVECTVLSVPATGDYYVVGVPAPGGAGTVIGLAAAADFTASHARADSSIAPGDKITAVVTQVPAVPAPAAAAAAGAASAKKAPASAKKGAKATAPAGPTPVAPSTAAVQAVNGLVLLSAGPVVRAAAAAKTKASAGKGAAAAAADASAGGVDVKSLQPGMEVLATITGNAATARHHHRKGGDAAAAGMTTGELFGDAGALPDITVRLVGVAGSYEARLPAAECVDFNPLTGAALPGGSAAAATADAVVDAAALALYKQLATSAAGTRVRVKIASVTTTSTGGVAIAITARPSDLALPELTLASARPATAASAAAVATVTSASPAAVAAANAASIFAAATAASDAPVLVAGATGYGVVIGANAEHGYVWLGLGGGVAARVPLLQAVDSDAVRDAATGMLRVAGDDHADALSLDAALAAHPVGSVVPFVVMSVPDAAPSAQRVVTASIRLAEPAFAAATAAAGAAPSAAKPTPSKKAKGASGAAAAAGAAVDVAGRYATATAAVAAWLKLRLSPSLTPGAVTYAVVVGAVAARSAEAARAGHSWRPHRGAQLPRVLALAGANVDSESDDSDDEAQDQQQQQSFGYPASASYVRLALDDASATSAAIAIADVSHLADRAQWATRQAARFHNGTVVRAVVLGAPCLDTTATATGGSAPTVELSLRQSLVESALGSTASTASTSGHKRKRGAAAAAPAAGEDDAAAAEAGVSSALKAEAAEVAAAGAVVSGFVVAVAANGDHYVRLARGVTGIVAAADVCDPARKGSKGAGARATGRAVSFLPGKLVTGKVLAIVASGSKPSAGISPKVTLSLRRSVVSPSAGKAADGARSSSSSAASTSSGLVQFSGVKPGQVYDATVATVAEFGVFCALDGTDRYGNGRGSNAAPLARCIQGLCHASEVADEPAAGAASGGSLRGQLAERFAAGDRVRVVVVSVDEEKKKLSLSMRASKVAQAAAAAAGSSAEDDGEEDVDDEELDEEEEDAFRSDDDGEDEDVDEDEDEDEDMRPRGKAAAAKGKAGAPAKGAKATSSAAAAGAGIFAALDSDDDDDMHAAGAAAAKARKSKAAAAAAALAATGGAASAGASGDRVQSDDEEAGGSDDEGAGVDSDDDGALSGGSVDGGRTAASSKSALRRAKKRSAEAEEEETRRAEERLASGEAETNPETVEDFERLVATYPNTSLAWIRYMAWQLSVTEVSAARAVAERALSTISFRQEAEKMNVWTAYLNLEVTYGDAASVGRVFQRAQQAADPKAVHFALLNIYQRSTAAAAAAAAAGGAAGGAAGRDYSTECEALFSLTAKKFGKEAEEVWPQWAAFRMRRGDAAGARALLTRALEVLPKKAHVSAILRFALLEYRFAVPAGEEAGAAAGAGAAGGEYGVGVGAGCGSQERARTMLESLLTTVPNRLDIWSVYVDQEVAALARRKKQAAAAAAGTKASKASAGAAAIAEETAAVRRLFDRVIALRSLSSKKMKFLLKKYMAFEQAHGDEAGVARVAAAAKAYVERQVAAAASAKGGDGADSGDDDDEDDE